MKKNLTLLALCISLVLAGHIIEAFAAEDGSASMKRVFSSIRTNQEYRIGSGDILEIITWKEPDLSREQVLVRIDGMITFPLINDIQAGDRTTMELQRDVTEGLKEFIENPVVTVTVIDPGSQKFYILGEVIRTGEYPLMKDLTILQAFALAGGFTEWASKKEILVLRSDSSKDKIINVNYRNPDSSAAERITLRDKGIERIIRLNYKSIVMGKDLKQNIKIRANDTIIVR